MSGFTTSGLNDAVNGVAAARYISAHTADPGNTGANEVTGGSYARQQTTWPSASSASSTGSAVAIPVPAGVTVTHWGLWTAATAGTFKFGGVLDAPESFGSAGTLTHTPTLTAANAG